MGSCRLSSPFVLVALLLGCSPAAAPTPALEEPAVDLGKFDGELPAELKNAVRKNLTRIEQDIDTAHLASYRLEGSTVETFRKALALEYGAQHPDMYLRKSQVLASIAFIQAPEVMPPASGRPTVFHGLDQAAYDRLMAIEDTVFDHLVELNESSVRGVRPFSVCETKYMIETYVKGQTESVSGLEGEAWDRYVAGYEAFAATCPAKDLDEWYNFRGLGKLRPSWLESNVMDRFLRLYNDICANAPDGDECRRYDADRLRFRWDRNAEFGRRMFLYAPDQEAFLKDPDNPLVIVPDQNGDGVAEIITEEATYTDPSGAVKHVTITDTGEFSGKLNVPPSKINAITAVDPSYDPALDLERADFGLFRIFPTAGGCDADEAQPESCPVLQRLYVMIDRHENFYSTYTDLKPNSTYLGKQPSPLVACSITLAAADNWAHNSPSGTDGFVYVMRIPFRDIIANGQTKSATRAAAMPQVSTLRELYQNRTPIDFGTLWVDIASLSNNLYESEHEISKFGYVPTEEVEGIIYTGTPATVTP